MVRAASCGLFATPFAAVSCRALHISDRREKPPSTVETGPLAERRKWVGVIESQSFVAKNEKMKRPTSPHLTIYRPQLTSVLSISNRITGAGLTVGMSIAGIVLGSQAFGYPGLEFYIDFIKTNPQWFPSWAIFSGKFILAFPFTFHTTNGIRHLAWDNLKGLQIGTLYQSGYVTVGIASVWAGLLCML